MAKNRLLEQKLNDFVNNFELNTTELNNLNAKKEIFKDKLLTLLVKNVCKTKIVDDEKLDRNEFICFKPSCYKDLMNIIDEFISENNIDDIKNTISILKDNLDNGKSIVKKKIRRYYLIDIFNNTNKLYNWLKKINIRDYQNQEHKISKLEQKYKPEYSYPASLDIYEQLVNNLHFNGYYYEYYGIPNGRSIYGSTYVRPLGTPYYHMDNPQHQISAILNNLNEIADEFIKANKPFLDSS